MVLALQLTNAQRTQRFVLHSRKLTTGVGVGLLLAEWESIVERARSTAKPWMFGDYFVSSEVFSAAAAFFLAWTCHDIRSENVGRVPSLIDFSKRLKAFVRISLALA